MGRKNEIKNCECLTEAEKRIEEEEIEQYDKDQKILELVKEQVSEAVYKEIEFEIEESENHSNFRIVTEPIGIQQRNTNDINNTLTDGVNNSINLFVDQHSIGDSGDSYAGTVSIQLSDKKYLAWTYWM